MSWWAYRFTLTHNTQLYYQFIREIINTSKLTIFEAIFRWNDWRRLSTAIHSPMWVMEQDNRLHYSWFCIRSSARSDLLLSGKPWNATADAAEATDDFFTFLLLNQERGVSNERLQSIQSVRHSKRTHRMWRHQKKNVKVFTLQDYLPCYFWIVCRLSLQKHVK